MTVRRHSRARATISMRKLSVLVLSTIVVFCSLSSVASALPENRAYELVSPAETNGNSPGSAVPALDGNTINFQTEPFGDAASGGQTLYQARRTASGWQTNAITPKDVVQSKFFAQTAELFFTPDLTKTVFTTEQPFALGDQDEGALDLYEESGPGELSWITQGTEGGTLPATATFDGATPDGQHIVFDSYDSLVPQATGIEGSPREDLEYLYDRNLSTGQTQLVNVDNEGKLLSPYGAILGNGTYLTSTEPPVSTFLPSDINGTTTHAISNDGTKIFFESPAPGAGSFRLGSAPPQGGTHLYMRKDNSVTVALDDPASTSFTESRYVGASEDGSKVFFISNEGLAGDSFKDTELYMYDTVAEKLTAISVVPEGEAPVEAAVYGVTAIANDGSHVYYVAKGKLASNENGQGQTAVEGEPNFYVYDTLTGRNTFITELGELEVEPGSGNIGALVSYLDIARPAIPTPDGKVLLFASLLNLTGENPNETGELYRYDTATEALVCVSCDPTGTGSASIGGGGVGGGTYAPPGMTAPMTADGEEIFFETENALVPEDKNTDAPPIVVYFGELRLEIPDNVDVYEWKGGKVYLLSSGKMGDASLQGVTPDGSDVLMATNVQLTKQSTDGYFAIYDARIGGGFPEDEVTVKAPCDGTESCRGGVAPNPVFTAPGSATFQSEPTPTPQAEAGSQAPPKKAKKAKQVKKKKKKAKTKHKAKKGKKASKGKRSSHSTHAHKGATR